MILPDFLNPKKIKEILEAAKIAKEVKASSRTPQQLRRGDFVIITLASSDKEGYVHAVKLGKTSSSVFLKTENGLEEVVVAKNNTIHIVKNADITIKELNEHNTYERDMHSISDKGTSQTGKDSDLHKFPQTKPEPAKVSDDKESALPATKKLSLKKGDFVTSSKGVESHVVEMIPDQKMAIVRSVDGKSIGTEYVRDLTPVTSSKRLSLKKKASVNESNLRFKLSLKTFGKSYENLNKLEQLDIDDQLSYIANE